MTSAGPSASSGPTASPGPSVCVPRIPAGIRVVTMGVDDDHVDDNDDIQPSVFQPEGLREAKERYAKFSDTEVEDVTEELIGMTSLGVAGWSFAKVHDWHALIPARLTHPHIGRPATRGTGMVSTVRTPRSPSSLLHSEIMTRDVEPSSEL